MLLSALRLTRLGLRFAWVTGLVVLIGLTAMPAVLHAAGYDTFTVRGGSMEPQISTRVGDRRPAHRSCSRSPPATSSRSTAPNDTVVTHRVLGRSAGSEPTLITQGDANQTPDPGMVPAAAVIGRVVFSVPEAGALLAGLTTTSGMVMAGALLLSLMIAGWFVDELRTILSAANSQRAATKLAT